MLLLLLFGRTYAAPLDMITPLDKRRRWIGILALVLFVFIFVPEPMVILEDAETPAGLRDSVFLLPMLTAVVVVAWQRLKARW